MALTQSKITAQGQISIPVGIRKRLGVGPGSVLEWDEQNGQVVVRKAGRHNSMDVHAVLFGVGANRETPVNEKEGIRKYIRRRHARD